MVQNWVTPETTNNLARLRNCNAPQSTDIFASTQLPTAATIFFPFMVRSSATWPKIVIIPLLHSESKILFRWSDHLLRSCLACHQPSKHTEKYVETPSCSPHSRNMFYFFTRLAKHKATVTPTSCASHVVASIFFHNTNLKKYTASMSSPGSASHNLRMSFPGKHFHKSVTRLRQIRCLDNAFVMVWQGRGTNVLQPRIPCPTCTVTSFLETQNWASSSQSDTAVLNGETPSAN